MNEVYFAQNPDPESDQAFIVTPIQGEDNRPLYHPEYAEILERIAELTGAEDPEARILIDIYRDGIVRRDNIPALNKAMSALDPAETLSLAALDVFDDEVETPDSRLFTKALYGVNDVWLVDTSGLVGPFVHEDGSVDLTIDHDVDQGYGSDSVQADIARTLGLTDYAYNTELVWRPDEKGTLQPRLLSRREHMTLGRLANGSFEPVVTVLRSDHPIRQESQEA